MSEKTGELLREPLDQHPSEFALIQLRARELDATAERMVVDHIAGCVPCQRRVESLSDEAAAFLARYPMADVVRTHRSPSSVSMWRRLLTAPRLRIAAACCASILLAVGVAALLSHRGARPPAIGPDERIKGGPIQWIVKRDKTQLVAGPDFPFRAGDAIGLVVLAARPAQLKVFSVDDRGHLEELMPAPGEPALVIQPGKRTVSPVSLHLEAPMSARRIFALLSSAPADTGKLRRLVFEKVRTLRGEHMGIAELTTLPWPGLVDSRFIPRLELGTEEKQ
jgi:hypothetical protein